MNRVTVNYQGAGLGFPLRAEAGQTVSHDGGAEFDLMRSVDLAEWETVVTAVPFAHQGASATYRLDRASGAGAASATLQIGAQ